MATENVRQYVKVLAHRMQCVSLRCRAAPCGAGCTLV